MSFLERMRIDGEVPDLCFVPVIGRTQNGYHMSFSERMRIGEVSSGIAASISSCCWKNVEPVLRISGYSDFTAPYFIK
jgi:hypothetical protein